MSPEIQSDNPDTHDTAEERSLIAKDYKRHLRISHDNNDFEDPTQFIQFHTNKLRKLGWEVQISKNPKGISIWIRDPNAVPSKIQQLINEGKIKVEHI